MVHRDVRANIILYLIIHRNRIGSRKKYKTGRFPLEIYWDVFHATKTILITDPMNTTRCISLTHDDDGPQMIHPWSFSLLTSVG